MLVDFFHFFLAAQYWVHIRAEADRLVHELAVDFRAVTVEAELIADDDCGFVRRRGRIGLMNVGLGSLADDLWGLYDLGLLGVMRLLWCWLQAKSLRVGVVGPLGILLSLLAYALEVVCH